MNSNKKNSDNLDFDLFSGDDSGFENLFEEPAKEKNTPNKAKVPSKDISENTYSGHTESIRA